MRRKGIRETLMRVRISNQIWEWEEEGEESDVVGGEGVLDVGVVDARGLFLGGVGDMGIGDQREKRRTVRTGLGVDLLQGLVHDTGGRGGGVVHVSEGEVGEEAGGLRAGQVGGTRIPDEEEGEGVIREVNLEGSGGPYLVGDSNVGSMW